MPTYEYECTKCGHEFERFQRMTESPVKRCPKCKGAVRRKIGTGAGLLFKGSGFYITDYRSEGYKKAAEKASEKAKDSSAPKSESSNAAKESAPAKPAAKAKAAPATKAK